MLEDLQIINENGQPYGIRDTNGFVLFFAPVQRFQGQDERYQNELRRREGIARYILDALEHMAG